MLLGDQNAIVASGIDKTYNGADLILDDVDLVVKHEQRVVLLGPNGAGKTTLMSSLVGAQAATNGNLTVGGGSLITAGSCGYCPQFNGLVPLLTVREHFFMVEVFKGVGREDRKAILKHFFSSKALHPSSQAIAKALHLDEHYNKRAATLSGGNQRKLSLALAILGQPRTLALDEPSTGLDPEVRRQVE